MLKFGLALCAGKANFLDFETRMDLKMRAETDVSVQSHSSKLDLTAEHAAWQAVARHVAASALVRSHCVTQVRRSSAINRAQCSVSHIIQLASAALKWGRRQHP